VPLGVGHLLEHRLGAPVHGHGAHRDGTNGEPQHGCGFRSGGQGIARFGKRTVDPCQADRYVQSVAGRAPLRFHADSPHAFQQSGEFIGDLHQFAVELVVLHALEDLVEPVQPPVETVVGAAPQPLPQFRVVLAPLPGGAEKAQ